MQSRPPAGIRICALHRLRRDPYSRSRPASRASLARLVRIRGVSRTLQPRATPRPRMNRGSLPGARPGARHRCSPCRRVLYAIARFCGSAAGGSRLRAACAAIAGFPLPVAPSTRSYRKTVISLSSLSHKKIVGPAPTQQFIPRSFRFLIRAPSQRARGTWSPFPARDSIFSRSLDFPVEVFSSSPRLIPIPLA